MLLIMSFIYLVGIFSKKKTMLQDFSLFQHEKSLYKLIYLINFWLLILLIHVISAVNLTEYY